MKRQPWWRRVRRYVTKRWFGYVHCRDFGMAVTNEDNTDELQAAIDYCGTVRLKSGVYSIGRPVVLSKRCHITGSSDPMKRIPSCGELDSTELREPGVRGPGDPLRVIYGTLKGP